MNQEDLKQLRHQVVENTYYVFMAKYTDILNDLEEIQEIGRKFINNEKFLLEDLHPSHRQYVYFWRREYERMILKNKYDELS